MALTPTTILTGFLGAGKTTLLNQLLQEPHGQRIAVIENEFGPESIDNEILVQDGNEQIVEMNNGCICCTVRGDLVVALCNLARRRDTGELRFDRVVIETTGLANPGPVAQTFFMDDEVAAHYLLDAVITIVDARHAMRQLDEHEEAQRQVGFADRVLLSKTDLATEYEIVALRERLKKINPRAPIEMLDFGRAPFDQILDLRGFNLNDKLEIDPAFLANREPVTHTRECAADCNHPPDRNHHGHRDDIGAFVFRSDRSFDSGRLDEFLAGLIQVYGPRMLRYKGVLSLAGSDRKVIFQGVHQTMGTDVGAIWDSGELRGSKIVFIGKNLPEEFFVRGLEQCLV